MTAIISRRKLAGFAAAALLALPMGVTLAGCGGGGGSSNNGGNQLPDNLPSTRFTANVPVTGGRRGLLNINVNTNGDAGGTLVLSNSQTSEILTTVAIDGNVNLTTRNFLLNGTYQDNGQPVTVTVSGTLPGGLGGNGPLTIVINGEDITGEITTGDRGGVISVVPTLSGTSSSTGKRFLYLRVGDDGAEYTQGFLTFDLSDLPAGSELVDARLALSQSAPVGNPASLGTLYLEPVTFTTLPSPSAAAPVAGAQQIQIAGQQEIVVADAVRQALSEGRRPQFRLRFYPGTTNNDAVKDYISVSGISMGIAYRR